MSEKQQLNTAAASKIAGRRSRPETDAAAAEEERQETAAVATSSVADESVKRRKVAEAGDQSEPVLSTIAAASSIVTPPQKTPSRNEKRDLATATVVAAAARLRFSSGPLCSEEEGEESAEDSKSEDPEAGCDNSSSLIDNSVSSPESEVCGDLPEMEPKSTERTTQSRSVCYDAPSADELEEFFQAAEKIEAQRFKEKYNFDIVSDVPVEGRFEWERVKP
uniref:Cyclin-dependent kinase inhibitor n=1 Tax=Kalanchoe fedtschenkoi TaxID=63787 RepID=A0A7N0ZRK3_KALFE